MFLSNISQSDPDGNKHLLNNAKIILDDFTGSSKILLLERVQFGYNSEGSVMLERGCIGVCESVCGVRDIYDP